MKNLPAIGLKESKDAVEVFEQYLDAIGGTSLTNVMNVYARLNPDDSTKVRLVKAVRLANTEARYIALCESIDAARKVIERDSDEMERAYETLKYYGMVDSENGIPF